ncbi:MAG: AAA family ATPase [Thermoplasmata archaeon]|nr:AAA family ATPase [Thermoplasmata archaeon]
MAERFETYIEGFDDKLDGGIPNESIVLLVGEPGTMKSSVGFNILFNNAKEKKAKCVYITLEQSTGSLVRHMKSMGMDHQLVTDNLEIVDIGLIRQQLTDLQTDTWLQVFKMYVKNLKDREDYDILVIDSLPVLDVLAKFEDPREDLFHLFEWLRKLGITTIMISEMNPDSRSYAKHDEDFLVDGIIYLRMVESGGVSVQRQIRCVKMRATNHSTDFYSLMFDGGRFKTTKVIGDSKK